MAINQALDVKPQNEDVLNTRPKNKDVVLNNFTYIDARVILKGQWMSLGATYPNELDFNGVRR